MTRLLKPPSERKQGGVVGEPGRRRSTLAAGSGPPPAAGARVDEKPPPAAGLEREALERCGRAGRGGSGRLQAHDRVVAADSKPAATLALLQDWWAAWQEAEHDPAQEVVVLATRRTEVDRLNTACQEVLAARGRLGAERLRVEDRQLAVGDRIVCGHNAIAELGVANGSPGTITALDPRVPPSAPPRRPGRPDCHPAPSYLDGRAAASATGGWIWPTDHRPPRQGLTRVRALVRLTGTKT